MTDLELLAPARNADIGIAAIDCGADAVYIAGPAFGARQAAGNDVEDIARLAAYAHRYGARVFVTVNTIVYDEELGELRSLLRRIAEAGADAIIVQDMAVMKIAREEGLDFALHASTQCAVRTPERASFLSKAGFSRLILERELSIDDIKEIKKASNGAEIEFFVHGALCVCYSGNCYLSEYLSGRSANRGACVQACRSRYDLEDANGKTILKNKAVLSLRDYNLSRRLADLAAAGVTSFKIEGRLKNESYVKNVVRAYSLALDAFIAANRDEYRRASFGRIEGGFEPDLDKTFNRGYTELFIDGKRGPWASMDAAKGMGEYVGDIINIARDKSSFTVSTSLKLANGDGFSFVAPNGEVVGFRADVCEGGRITCNHPVPELFKGAALYRNIDIAFERTMAANPCRRLLDVSLAVNVAEDGFLVVNARSEDGRSASVKAASDKGVAENRERMEAIIKSQLSKTSGCYRFSVDSFNSDCTLPFLAASQINESRRSLAEMLDAQPCCRRPMAELKPVPETCPESLTYKENISNAISREFFSSLGASSMEDAYELSHRKAAELMRTKYCVRAELGLCLRENPSESGPLYIKNNGRRLVLRFDCRRCEMTVSEA